MKKFIVIVIVLIMVFINLYCMGLKSQERMKEKQAILEKEKIETSVNIDAAENIMKEVAEEKIEEVKTEEVKQEKKEETVKDEVKKQEVKKTEKPKENIEKEKKYDIIKEDPTVIITEETKQEVFVEEQEVVIKKEETSKEEKKEEIVIAEDVKIAEEYKINKSKITEMENIIKNNPSEDMLLYGYEIVVDSSIVNMTNQFTFTEKRVKDKIAWKFGTIRIYAQDYYCNGEYVCTECFII